jgi:hypothetical protein
MAREKRGASNSDSDKRETIGNIVLWVGILGILISIIMLGIGCSHLPEPESLSYGGYGGIGLLVSLLVLAVGWCVGSSAGRRQEKSPDSDDARSKRL